MKKWQAIVMICIGVVTMIVPGMAIARCMHMFSMWVVNGFRVSHDDGPTAVFIGGVFTVLIGAGGLLAAYGGMLSLAAKPNPKPKRKSKSKPKSVRSGTKPTEF